MVWGYYTTGRVGCKMCFGERRCAAELRGKLIFGSVIMTQTLLRKDHQFACSILTTFLYSIGEMFSPFTPFYYFYFVLRTLCNEVAWYFPQGKYPKLPGELIREPANFSPGPRSTGRLDFVFLRGWCPESFWYFLPLCFIKPATCPG